MTSAVYSFKLYLIQGQPPRWEEGVGFGDAALSSGGKFFSNLGFTVKNHSITTHLKHFLTSQWLALNLAGKERLIFDSLDINMVLFLFIHPVHNICLAHSSHSTNICWMSECLQICILRMRLYGLSMHEGQGKKFIFYAKDVKGVGNYWRF